ncbi:putative pentatricopeptide repeat-containing protein At5g52630 [Papaver somniferum]|nr:putative pentatricopeptide repeat-containing protein At5g52630 [Papaver somniferum]
MMATSFTLPSLTIENQRIPINFLPTYRKRFNSKLCNVSKPIKLETSVKTFSKTHQDTSISNTGDISSNGFAENLDRLSLISTIGECSKNRNLVHGKQCHGLVLKLGFDQDKFVATTLVNLYSKCGDLESACKLFDKSSEWDIVSWNSFISGYSSNGMYNEALNYCMQVFTLDIEPNHYTFSIGLSICASVRAVEEGRQLHAYIVKMEYFAYPAVGNSLLTMYSKFGMMDEVEILFKELPEKNLISWTAIITGFYRQRCFAKALRQFCHMRESGEDPNEHTFVVVMASCGCMFVPMYGRMIHAQAIKFGMASGVFVGTAILDMYSETKQMDDARKQFEEMGVLASDVSWNALVAAYVRNGKMAEALEAFDRMLGNGVSCDQFTYSNVLKVCSSIPSLSSGQQIHAHLIKFNCESNMHVGSSLIEMYAKCGNLADAEYVFHSMPTRDMISWNSIIKAYSQNGYPKKAIMHFRKMTEEEGIKPTSITFVAVLSACSHSGLVDEGLDLFASMIRDYEIIPEETHFSCMVDLLGRAGRLEEAKDFASNLPFKPKASIWRPLLAACRSHRNLKMAEFVAERITKLEPGDPTVHITLSNMYAESGRWGDVDKIRKILKLSELKKEPGCSWIEVSNRMHRFYSRDMKHTEMPKVYGKLNDLVKQIKDLGYTPDTSVVLHQGVGVSKEEQVLYHSEKLAVCFGLLNLPTGKPIRVFKNLRVCQDCHSAMKFISEISKRDIVLRDNYRFHHFNQGSCSCGDYW